MKKLLVYLILCISMILTNSQSVYSVGTEITESISKKDKKIQKKLDRLQKKIPKKAKQLEALYINNTVQADEKVALVKKLFIESGAPTLLKNQVNNYTEAAFDLIPKLHIARDHKLVLKHLGQRLMKRVV